MPQLAESFDVCRRGRFGQARKVRAGEGIRAMLIHGATPVGVAGALGAMRA